jgi:peptidoglycan/LPS O-acetylase OafA/YrhL
VPYIPALAGLRAVAILLVIVFHAHGPVLKGGFVGVDVFFVLSGFLITSLLLAEWEETKAIDLRAFYRRRLLRLTPPLFAMLAVYLIVAPHAWPTGRHALSALLAAVYVADYSRAFWDIPAQLSHTWSLSVEEHFYLLWPLALLFARRRLTVQQLAGWLGAAWLFATLWRAVCLINGHGWQEVYCRFDTHASGIVLGCALAAAARDRDLMATIRRCLPSAAWWLPAVALAVWRYEWGSPDVVVWGLSVVELATAAILVDLTNAPAGAISRALSRPTMVWIGTMSYGMYLWHYPVFRFMAEVLEWPWWLQLVTATPLSIALAALSFHTVEASARRLRAGDHETKKAPQPEMGQEA